MVSRNSRASPRAAARGGSPLYVVLCPSARDGVTASAMRCLRRLVPGAVVLVPPDTPPADADEVVAVEAEEIVAGPLSAARALDRGRSRARCARVPAPPAAG